MGTRDPRIDTYIAKRKDFAKPILTHLRNVVHAACPDVEETLKWNAPFFVYNGGVLLAAAAADLSAQPGARPASSSKTKIVFLGTGNPAPTPERMGPAVAIVVNGTPYLVDAGVGVDHASHGAACRVRSCWR